MSTPTPAELAAQLRKSVFTVHLKQLSSDQAFRNEPCLCVLMETGYEKAVATLFTTIDGTASLYFSSGGGVIGGQGQEITRVAARRFTQFAGVHLSEMSPCVEFPLPQFGQAIFYALTSGGVFAHGVPEQNLGRGDDSFSPLFRAGHYVITELLKVTQKNGPALVPPA